jgi:hypothetical protein
MKKLNFEMIDAGCWMINNESSQRWIIIQPTKGYETTISKMWDVLIEDFDEPNKKPVKFLGSFISKEKALSQVENFISKGETYKSIIGLENEFYFEDYKPKFFLL